MSRVTPFVVARPGLALAGVAGVTRVDPLRLASAPLLAAIARLDARAGLASPRWVLFDCAELPGAVIGLAGEGLEPLGIVSATPMIDRRHWLLGSLASLDPRRAPHVALVELALRVLAPSRVTATARWGGPELAAYAALGPLRLGAAWLPALDEPATCAFELAPGARPAGAPRPIDRDGLVALQRALEDGARVLVVAGAGGGLGLAAEARP